MGFLKLQVLHGGRGFDPGNTFLPIYSKSQIPAEEILFQLSNSHKSVQMETWPGLVVGGAESQPSLTDDSEMQNKFFNTNRMQLMFWEQDLSFRNLILSSVFTKQKDHAARCWSTQDAQAKAKIKSQFNTENWTHASYRERDLQWSKAWM